MTASALLGAVLIAIAFPFGDEAPWLMLATPLAGLVVAAVFAKPLLAVFVIFAAQPLGVAGLPLGLGQLTAVEAAILLVTLLVALRRVGLGKTPLSWSPELWWILAFLTWALIATRSAGDQVEATKNVVSMTYDLIMVCLVLTVCRTPDDIRRSFGIFNAAAALVTIPAIAGGSGLQASYGGEVVTGRVAGFFSSPNSLGSFCALATLVALGMGFAARSRNGRVASFICLGIQLVGLTLSLSRGAWIGTVAGIVFLLITLSEVRNAVLPLMAALVVGMIVVILLAVSATDIQIIEERAETLRNIDEAGGDRPALWGEALRQIRADPWTGQGPGNFDIAIQRPASAGLVVTGGHAHNTFLNIGAEMGLPGVALFIGFLLAVARASRKALRQAVSINGRDRALMASLCAVLIYVVIHGLVDTIGGNPVNDVGRWAVMGALLVLVHQEKGSGSAQALDRLAVDLQCEFHKSTK